MPHSGTSWFYLCFDLFSIVIFCFYVSYSQDMSQLSSERFAAVAALHSGSISFPCLVQFFFHLFFSPIYSILLSTLRVASCPWTRRVSSPNPQVIARLVRTFILIPPLSILIKRKKNVVVHREALLLHRLTPARCPPIRWPSLFVEQIVQVNRWNHSHK